MDLQHSYRQRGYHVFRNAIPVEAIDALAGLVDSHIRHQEEPLLRHDASFATHRFVPGTGLIENSLLDCHLPFTRAMQPVEAALASIIGTPAMASRLRQLDGAAHYTIHQTIFFFLAQNTELHFDGWGLDTVPHGYAHTLWIPLQDMTARSGLPCVVPWELGKFMSEADLGVSSEGDYRERYERYYGAFIPRLMHDRPDVTTSLVRKGDFMVWSSLTPHLSLPAMNSPFERMSLQVLLRPSHMPWGNFITQPEEIWHGRYINPSPDISYLVKPEHEHRLYA